LIIFTFSGNGRPTGERSFIHGQQPVASKRIRGRMDASAIFGLPNTVRTCDGNNVLPLWFSLGRDELQSRFVSKRYAHGKESRGVQVACTKLPGLTHGSPLCCTNRFSNRISAHYWNRSPRYQATQHFGCVEWEGSSLRLRKRRPYSIAWQVGRSCLKGCKIHNRFPNRPQVLLVGC
jgi:hypothetical protein